MMTPDEEAGHDVPADDGLSAVKTLFEEHLVRFESGSAVKPPDAYFIVGQLHESLPLEVRVKAANIIAVVEVHQHVPRRAYLDHARHVRRGHDVFQDEKTVVVEMPLLPIA